MTEQPPPPNDETEVQNLVEQAMAEAQASLGHMQDQVAGSMQKPEAVQPANMVAASPQAVLASGAAKGIELLSDVDLHVKVELGRTEMLVEDVLRLTEGSIVELDKLAGDPVDVYVNHRLVARGEVLVLNDNFCIRISEILANLEEHEPIQAVHAS